MKLSKIISTSFFVFSLMVMGCSKSINALDEEPDLTDGGGVSGGTSAGGSASGGSGSGSGTGEATGGGVKIGANKDFSKLVKGEHSGKLGALLGSFKHEAGSSVSTISLEKISRYKTGVFDKSATEIVVYDKTTKKFLWLIQVKNRRSGF